MHILKSINGRMNSGLEGMCEDAFIIKFEVLSWYLVGGTREKCRKPHWYPVCIGQDWNTQPDKIRIGAARLWHSVILRYIIMKHFKSPGQQMLIPSKGISFKTKYWHCFQTWCVSDRSDGCSNRWCSGTVSSLQNK